MFFLTAIALEVGFKLTRTIGIILMIGLYL
jgi:hypothetical protein